MGQTREDNGRSFDGDSIRNQEQYDRKASSNIAESRKCFVASVRPNNGCQIQIDFEVPVKIPEFLHSGICYKKSYVSNVRTFTKTKRTDLLVNVGMFRNVIFFVTDPRQTKPEPN